MNYFVHPQAICETNSVGSETKIWAFSHLLPNCIIGSDCNINDGVFIENDVVVGDRVTIKSGVQLWDGIRLEDDVFVGPNVTFTNDVFPRSKKYPEKFLSTFVLKGASLGANSTILPGITIGRGAMVGAGSVVTRNVPDFAIVVGNPARIVGYDTGNKIPITKEFSQVSEIETSIHDLGSSINFVSDIRGQLIAGNFSEIAPFPVKRFFAIKRVPSEAVRGEHAHIKCHQLLICLSGTLQLMTDDGRQRKNFHLSDSSPAVHVPPLTWASQFKYSSDAVLLVLASDEYDPEDYIRDYSDFLEHVSQNN